MLHDSELILVGSNSVHTLRYLNAIAPHFKRVVFISSNADKLKLNHNVSSYSINFNLSNFKAPKQIAKIFELYPTISILHIQQANSYAYHALRAVKLSQRKFKTVLTTWGSDVLLLPYQNIFFKKMVQFNLNNVDIITSDSLYMSAQIRQLAPGVRNIVTINFGMQNFPETFDLTKKEPVILSNRLHKELYNIDKIIYGFANLIKKPQYNQFKLVIAANGAQTEQLQVLSVTLGIMDRVIFTGMLSSSELALWYQKASIFVSIPQSDAASLSVLEAMGYGCYPILSNLPANLEWVINEINGTICQNPVTIEVDFAHAIEQINNRAAYTKMAQFNYELIKRKAIFSDNLKKFLQLYTPAAFETPHEVYNEKLGHICGTILTVRRTSA